MTDLLACVLGGSSAEAESSCETLRAAGVQNIARVELTRPGAWAAARNEALARAEAFEFLALVEGGVRVSSGWLDGWRAARDEAAAVFGGPITPEGIAAAGIDPAAHGQVLGLPAAGRVASGNAILRTSALRAVGGFSPVAGHPAAVDGLADWQLALEALEAAGWTVICDERLAATRAVDDVSYLTLLRRRLHTGARKAALSPEPATAPLIGAARSALAATRELVRLDRAAAADRLAWSAAQVGEGLGPLVAHKGLQPDRTRTPWRPSVAAPLPSPLRRAVPSVRRGHGGAYTVLLYHRVCDQAADPLAVSVSPDNFAAQMEWLAHSGRAATLAEVASGRAPRRAIAVTFDDGYHDNLANALPVLERTSVPATLFAATGQIERGEGFWWDTVGRLLAAGIAAGRPGPLTLDLAEGARSWRPGPDTPIEALLDQVHAALRPRVHQEIAAAVDQIAQWAGESAHPPPSADRPLTVEELRELAASPWFDVQSHGRDHLSLALVPDDARATDLKAAADDLTRWLGTRPRHVAYPFGVPGTDVDQSTQHAAADAGYELGVVNNPGRVEGADPFAIPRLAVPDIDGVQFARWLDARI